MALHLYRITPTHIVCTVWQPGSDMAPDTLWFDLFCPTVEEEAAVETCLQMEIPTREEMREIEISNRLYTEQCHQFMTATMLAKFDIDSPENHAVTFIVSEQRMVTVRYADPLPFRTYASQVERLAPAEHNGHGIFLGLMDAVINRAADIIEIIGQEVDRVTREVFRPRGSEVVDYQQALQRIGQCGDSASKVRESLITLARLTAYASQNLKNQSTETTSHLVTQSRDVAALGDHAAFVANKVTFVLDATLGMINIVQNDIIKIFSIAAVMFLPPTLVASIYGMNFHHMPELGWHLGYPMALLLMLISAALPYFYFKRKKWL